MNITEKKDTTFIFANVGIVCLFASFAAMIIMAATKTELLWLNALEVMLTVFLGGASIIFFGLMKNEDNLFFKKSLILLTVICVTGALIVGIGLVGFPIPTRS